MWHGTFGNTAMAFYTTRIRTGQLRKSRSRYEPSTQQGQELWGRRTGNFFEPIWRGCWDPHLQCSRPGWPVSSLLGRGPAGGKTQRMDKNVAQCERGWANSWVPQQHRKGTAQFWGKKKGEEIRRATIHVVPVRRSRPRDRRPGYLWATLKPLGQ